MKQPKVILVNQGYPADCLIFKALINVNQPQYRVPGHEDALVLQRSPMTAPSSDTSLQLKPEKGDNAPLQQTPSRSEGSEQLYTSRVPEGADLANRYSLQRNSMAPQIGGGEQTASDGVTNHPDPVTGSSPQRGSAHPYTHPQNDLDMAIKEAQATKDLVSIHNFDCADNVLTFL